VLQQIAETVTGTPLADLVSERLTGPLGIDGTDWSASYGQGGGGVYCVVEDLGVRAASMSGNALLGDELAAERLTTSDIGGGLLYGLRIMQLGPWIGHEGGCHRLGDPRRLPGCTGVLSNRHRDTAATASRVDQPDRRPSTD
jgi:CubicO group peptidase (beta-lactamase class C family)